MFYSKKLLRLVIIVLIKYFYQGISSYSYFNLIAVSTCNLFLIKKKIATKIEHEKKVWTKNVACDV